MSHRIGGVRAPREWSLDPATAPTPWWATVILILSCVVIAVVASIALTPHKASTDAMSTVRVEVGPIGHGSAVHIGDGFLLTAGHVATDAKELTTTDSLGVSRRAEVLWVAPKYDLALMRLYDHKGLATSQLDCDKRAADGTPVTAVGNPLDLKFVTTRGHVASAFSVEYPLIAQEWQVVDATIAPGMSGGPVLNTSGKVVGIISAMPGYFPITLMVPAKVACNLMGRP